MAQYLLRICRRHRASTEFPSSSATSTSRAARTIRKSQVIFFSSSLSPLPSVPSSYESTKFYRLYRVIFLSLFTPFLIRYNYYIRINVYLQFKTLKEQYFYEKNVFFFFVIFDLHVIRCHRKRFTSIPLF